ncbi:MAG: hypothetical protein ACK559_38235, partial [bacterium]
ALDLPLAGAGGLQHFAQGVGGGAGCLAVGAGLRAGDEAALGLAAGGLGGGVRGVEGGAQALGLGLGGLGAGRELVHPAGEVGGPRLGASGLGPQPLQLGIGGGAGLLEGGEAVGPPGLQGLQRPLELFGPALDLDAA